MVVVCRKCIGYATDLIDVAGDETINQLITDQLIRELDELGPLERHKIFEEERFGILHVIQQAS